MEKAEKGEIMANGDSINDLVKKEEGCTNLNELLKAQIGVIKRHIKKHKWYLHEAQIDKAVADFAEKYGFIMREIYCDAACSKSKECTAYQNYLKNNKEIDLES